MYTSTGMSPQMWALIGIICVLLLVVFPIIIMKAMGGRKKWQNRLVQPVIDDYMLLANQLQVSPPHIPDYQGYKSWPILTVKKNNAHISVTPATIYSADWEKHYLYRDPYSDLSPSDRMNGAMGMQVAQAFMGTQRRRSHSHSTGQQITDVKLLMPQSLKGSRILITPETLIGTVFSMGEIKLNHAEMDSKFNVRGLNEQMVKDFLTPDLCNALIQFRQKHGKFQLNENALVWFKMGYGVGNLPIIINDLVQLSDLIYSKFK